MTYPKNTDYTQEFGSFPHSKKSVNLLIPGSAILQDNFLKLNFYKLPKCTNHRYFLIVPIQCPKIHFYLLTVRPREEAPKKQAKNR